MEKQELLKIMLAIQNGELTAEQGMEATLTASALEDSKRGRGRPIGSVTKGNAERRLMILATSILFKSAFIRRSDELHEFVAKIVCVSESIVKKTVQAAARDTPELKIVLLIPYPWGGIDIFLHTPETLKKHEHLVNKRRSDEVKNGMAQIKLNQSFHPNLKNSISQIAKNWKAI